ncbi:6914_t:CDS:2, partial [Racocetra persica]
MPPSSKGKRKARNQNRNGKGRYCNPKKVLHISVILTDQENLEDKFGELYNSDREGELDVSDRKESKDDGWNKYDELNVSDLEWGDKEDKKIKRGPYMKGWTLKSTYYDKYEPNGIFTKAAVGTKKITSFFNNIETQVTNLQPNELDKVSSDSESETDSYVYKINKRAKDLKKQLDQNHGILTVKEYNYKRAIFEYLSLLSNNNGHGKIKASLEVMQKVFIDGGMWKVRTIRYFTEYWLLNDKLPSSRHGKHQKTIRIIDDEDIEIKCHIWIKSQNFKITLATFKKFIEDELFSS